MDTRTIGKELRKMERKRKLKKIVPIIYILLFIVSLFCVFLFACIIALLLPEDFLNLLNNFLYDILKFIHAY